jgi:hypothetical protein
MMTARDFIYHFTDILFSEIVKETILIENWEEADFDYRYAEFADIFFKMKENCLDPARTDKEIFDMLNNSRSTAVRNFKDEMQKNFITEFNRNGINDALFDKILPADLFNEDSVNTKCLERFREFEEKTFTQKPKRGA